MILVAKSNFLPSFIVIFFSIISCDNESTVSGNYLKINGFAQGSTFNIIYDDQRDLSSEINAVLTDFDKELSFVCLSSEPKPIMKNNIEQMSDIFSQITNQLV